MPHEHEDGQKSSMAEMMKRDWRWSKMAKGTWKSLQKAKKSLEGVRIIQITMEKG